MSRGAAKLHCRRGIKVKGVLNGSFVLHFIHARAGGFILRAVASSCSCIVVWPACVVRDPLTGSGKGPSLSPVEIIRLYGLPRVYVIEHSRRRDLAVVSSKTKHISTTNGKRQIRSPRQHGRGIVP